MLQITETEIKTRLAFDNPWWESGKIAQRFREWPRRAYFDAFTQLVARSSPKRSIVLMGPRRVGKTVMLLQTIQHLIDTGTKPQNIAYVSVDTPTYTGLPLETLLRLFLERQEHGRDAGLYVFFDEIQYHQDWERHLKSLTDSYPSITFVASGSAAAALKLKSDESGAGRFTDFVLPPLNFAEFLEFSGASEKAAELDTDTVEGIEFLNDRLMDYIRFGGFPEAVNDLAMREDMARYVANDIIDKVLLRDIPSLYGIADPQELKRFFTMLAFNTGAELSYANLSKSSGIAKNTIRKYLDYLEAAFLIRRLKRVDQNAKRLKREVNFKVYLTNPSIRSALFGPLNTEDPAFGLVMETAFIAQMVQSGMSSSFYYSRWSGGEVDLVWLDQATLKPMSATEIKWTDRAWEQPSRELQSLLSFCRKTGLQKAVVSTRTRRGQLTVEGIEIYFGGLSLLCLVVAAEVVGSFVREGFNLLALEEIFGKLDYISGSEEKAAI